MTSFLPIPLRHPPACVSMHHVCCPIISGMWVVTVETLLSWSPLVLHIWSGHGLVIMCPVATGVDQQRRPGFLLCESVWCELGRSPYLDLLGGDLVVRRVLRTCSAGTWSFAPPRRLARRGLDRSCRLVDLLGGVAVTWSFAPPRRLTWWGLDCSRHLMYLLGKWLERGIWASPWVPRSWVLNKSHHQTSEQCHYRDKLPI
jgi:hypothetical protein